MSRADPDAAAPALFNRVIDLVVRRDAVGPVKRGHPWVFADAVDGRPAPGTIVRLRDERNKPIGFGLADEGPIAVRVLGRHPEALTALVPARLQAATALRAQVLPPDTDTYRLINAAGDGLPGIVVDRYGPLAVLKVYSRAWERHLDLVVDALAALDGVETVFRRFGVRRVDGRGGGETLRGPEAPDSLVVVERGLRFVVRPRVGQKTGLFLDQREHRHLVRGWARGLRVLNLFAYTGGFSVAAAAGGAAHVTTVDIAAPAIADARENFALNGFDPDAHAFAAADAFQWKGGPYDLVICDPPHLSRASGADKAARNAYRDLAARSGALVRPGGLLVSASCTARLTFAQWEAAVREGLAKAGRWSLLHQSAAPPDHPVALEHPEGRYLKLEAFRRQ